MPVLSDEDMVHLLHGCLFFLVSWVGFLLFLAVFGEFFGGSFLTCFLSVFVFLAIFWELFGWFWVVFWQLFGNIVLFSSDLVLTSQLLQANSLTN